MTQRHQTCDALQQIEAHGEDGQNHHAGDGLCIKILLRKRKRQQSHQTEQQKHLHAARQRFQMGLRCTHCLNKPSGLYSSTKAINT